MGLRSPCPQNRKSRALALGTSPVVGTDALGPSSGHLEDGQEDVGAGRPEGTTEVRDSGLRGGVMGGGNNRVLPASYLISQITVSSGRCPAAPPWASAAAGA